MKRFLPLVIIFIFGMIASLDLLHPGFPVTHDTQDHIARIANFYQNLSEGVLVPRWAANLNYGFGHPILEFLYPLPSYFASLFHFLGFSFIDSTKLVYGIAMIASGFTMYLFAKAMFGKSAGVVGAILYMYAPYRFVDLYVRGDIGEHVAFVFLPLVFWGLYKLYQDGGQRYVLLTGLFVALFILAHNAISLMTMPLVLAFALYLWWRKKYERKFFIGVAAGIILGFLLASFFWVPALLEGQYTLRNIVTKGQYATKFVNIQALLYGPWSYSSWDITGKNNLTVQLGIVQWIFLFLSLGMFLYYTKQKRTFYIFEFGLILFTMLAIFLMLPASNFIWSRVALLQNFQFPWRFLAIPVFTLSLLAALLVSRLVGLYKYLVVALVALSVLFLSKDYMHAKSYEVMPESFFTGIYSRTTDTGESSPIWSVRFMEQGYGKPLVDLVDNAVIVVQKRTPTVHTYTVSTNEQVRMLENTLYFPGWSVVVDGKSVDVQFQDPKYRGLITFFVPSGTHTVSILYHESKLRVIGDTLSLIGLGGFLLYWVYAYKKRLL